MVTNKLTIDYLVCVCVHHFILGLEISYKCSGWII